MKNVPMSQLPTDIKQIMVYFIEKGQQISETLKLRIQSFCAAQLIGILQSYPEYIEKSKDMSCSKGLEIIISCIYFRDLVTTIAHNTTEDTRESLAVLMEVETKKCDQLLEKLLYDVKICLTDNLKDDGLSRSLNMEEVRSLITCYFAQFSNMNRAACKTLVERAHCKIVQEYITVLINSSLRCASNNWYQISDKIIQDSNQLQQFFAEQEAYQRSGA
ncbi:tumor necrosis factor alpha-induced protein 2-like [Cetorhinus maximus]